MYDNEFLEEMKQRLLDEQKRVEGKIKELTAPEEGDENPNWDDTATDAIEDVEQESLLRIYRNLQQRVEGALKRMEEGSYGTCLASGEQIPEKRLQQEPWAEYCVEEGD